MKIGTRSKILLLIGAAMALATAGCSGGLLNSGSSGTATSSGTVKLGMVVPLSGSSAPTGAYMRNGAQLAVDEINKAGGVLKGRKLELLVEDEACDAQQAVASANKVVSAGVVVSVGGYCSGATLPTLPIFQKANVPMIIPAANSQELVAQRLPNVFLINGTGKQQSTTALAFMKKSGFASVVLVDDNTSYSKDITTETQAQIQKDGSVQVLLKTSVTAGESDYSAVVREIVAKNPALVYWTGYYQEGGLIINQLRKAGFTGKIMVADGSVDPSLAKIAGSGGEGVFATMTQTPDTLKGAEKWIANYKAKFNADPGPYSTQAYDAVRLAAKAIGNAGGTKGGDVIKALTAINGFPMFSGPLKFTADRTLSSGGFVILVIKDGKFTLDTTPS